MVFRSCQGDVHERIGTAGVRAIRLCQDHDRRFQSLERLNGAATHLLWTCLAPGERNVANLGSFFQFTGAWAAGVSTMISSNGMPSTTTNS